jgi:predicted DNA-binding transcriptional regulator YafY
MHQEIFRAIKNGRYPNRTKLAETIEELAKAIQNKEVVEYGYKKLDAKAFEKRTVERWHLACVSGQWYLLGYDRNRKARRIFVLAPMRKISRTDHKFSNSRPGEGEIQPLFGTAFKMAKRERRTRANRFSIFRPSGAARSGAELACEPADPGVSRR